MNCIKITSKPPSFYERSIRALFFPWATSAYSNKECAYAVLPLCLGVTRLTCWISPHEYDPRLASLIVQMRPTWLSARFEHLLKPGHPDFSIPFFSRVTHLEVLDETWHEWRGFDRLPCLTHIRVSWPVDFRDPMGAVMDKYSAAVNFLLEQCPRLEVCVLRHGYGEDGLPPSRPFTLPGVEDDRVVYILQCHAHRMDWEAFLSEQPDTWDFTDARVTEQRENCCRLPASQVYDVCGHIHFLEDLDSDEL